MGKRISLLAGIFFLVGAVFFILTQQAFTADNIFLNNVGIGTTTAPSGMLEVQKIGTASSFLISSAPGKDGDYLIVNSSGNVGIGTNVPLSRVDLMGAGATAATTSLIVRDSNRAIKLIVQDDGNVGVGSATPLKKFVVAGDVNVGIGTVGSITANRELIMRETGGTYGWSQLRVVNETGMNGVIFETEGLSGANLVDFIFRAPSTTSNIRLEGRAASTFSGVAPEWEFGTAADPNLVITQSGPSGFRYGNVGIGSPKPAGKLDVIGDIRFTARLVGTSTTNVGIVVTVGANTACDTTCVGACLGGQDTGAAPYPIVACNDATADRCFCFPAS